MSATLVPSWAVAHGVPPSPPRAGAGADRPQPYLSLLPGGAAAAAGVYGSRGAVAPPAPLSPSKLEARLFAMPLDLAGLSRAARVPPIAGLQQNLQTAELRPDSARVAPAPPPAPQAAPAASCGTPRFAEWSTARVRCGRG